MPYGGSMEISFESEYASEIEWRTKPFTFDSAKHFYMRLPKYSN